MKTEIIRHSLSHILATAVQGLFPGTKFGIGPAIENGFYYDFDLPKSLAPEDLPKIEEKMREIIKQNILFKKRKLLKSDFNRLFKDQPYKLELIEELTEKDSPETSIYQVGDFVDLCQGPHVKNTKEIPEAFKLTKIAGAYWRGSERNPMLTRIYGVAFKTKKELDEYLLKEVEAEKRDHRILGQKLELFLFDEEVGAGLPIWQPKGAILRNIITDYLYKELTNQGYQWIVSPHIGKLDLWKTSGHWDLYRENMYSPIDIEGEKYLLKPMNCPFHIKIYQSKIRSYKELPLYFAELGTVYRYERSGVLHGLTRVRGFTQDDAHIVCASGQLAKEVEKLLKAGFKTLKAFGFKDYDIYLSTRPEKYAGTEKGWQRATNSLKYVLENLKLKYQIDPGGGVFYGPKIDIKIKDSLGRPWQCTTIQIDFNLPARFKMTYIDEKGKKQEPLMIHRALLGSIERFIGVLLEHYGGALPLWLAPEQIWIIPVGSRHEKYAKEVGERFKILDLRFKIKDENETVSKKIREGEIQKIPYLLVVGDREMKLRAVRIRKRRKGDIGMVKLNKFVERVKIEIEKKK
ncbi:MAG: threonine--tRNA ligase [Candidatus Nealsonbacteria bacterium CG23_combo_of_CG06-09_8_20_14_all_36_12]|uniref:Threonine--tRNA ligase n=2 Tax=Candidatus Nealsoniibacteriota TaxID=1817911 RepID=A0A2H0TLP7_9BACT|nr:MAG: threonine--tRNA ligase [Candidatus Nealsonbacteria bacterium CG23_combo_of_CG06-09_8_20_14_all_36_12]PIR73078.1 MAG: threonine--tRNA ligase [Candidatus Nealsonbacteria bacterium CG10_big_fil_rev_8_21_14_0_10_36_23]